MDVVDAWLGARSARVLHPGQRHAALFRQMLDTARGNLANDAHLAALAAEHRATVVSFDSDFGRFPGVRWERPR
jgi:predicted nucleic acid-binding protein